MPFQSRGLIGGLVLSIILCSKLGLQGCYFLFDLSTDPNEETNLYYDSDYADVVGNMTERMFELGAEASSEEEDDNDNENDADSYAEQFGFWGPFLSYYDPWTEL